MSVGDGIGKAIEAVAPEVYKDVAHPAAKDSGEILETITGFFNHVVLAPLKKLNIVHEQKTKAFERKMAIKYGNIPEEYRVEPELRIVGPALESLKYNIMDDDIAEMFSNLLVNDMDARTQTRCTPAFIQSIGQMSHNDAIAFKHIVGFCKRSAHYNRCTMVYKDKRNHTFVSGKVPMHFILDSIADFSAMEISNAIENLTRLGFIELSRDHHYINDHIVRVIHASDVLKGAVQQVQESTGIEVEPVVYETGCLYLTNFGTDFAEICLGE